MNKSVLDAIDENVQACRPSDRREHVLADMRLCEPADAMSTTGERDHWRLYDYETETGIKGWLLFAGQEEQLVDLRLRLPVTGRYQIRIGVLADDGMGNWTAPCIKIKLNRDPCFSEIVTRGDYYWANIRDTYWREENLADDEIVIRKARHFKGGIAYVRLIPVDEKIHEEPDAGDEPYLVVTNDSYSAYESVEELYEKIFPLRNTSVKKLLFCFASGDCCYYLNTSVGTRFRDLPMENRVFPRALDRHFGKTIAGLASRCDVLRHACDFTHSLGIEFHASVRMEAFAMHPPMDCFTSFFYQNNPQWRCTDYDGRSIARMSYAYPEVQRHMLSLFEEFLQYDIDGLNLIFTRGLPVMLYEDVLIDGFRKDTGIDARDLPENDERFLRYRAGVLTDFIRNVRKSMDRRCAALGRRKLQISIVVPANGDVNRTYGLDLETWVAEGLVDFICPDMSLQNLLHDESPENIDLDYYENVVSTGSADLLPRMPSYHELMSRENYRKKFAEVFHTVRKHGSAGMMLWDGAHTFYHDPDVWQRLAHFGKIYPDRLPETVVFRELSGFAMDRYPAHMCF